MNTISQIKESFKYIDGGLYWINSRKRINAGDRAGSLKNDGYRRVTLDGKSYAEHRIVWVLINGSWPEKQLDHINNKRDDNRIENLRQASSSQNIANIIKTKGASLFKGVSWHKANKKWVSQIKKDATPIYLGSFDSEVAAALAYDQAAKQFHGEFAALNFGGSV